MHDIMKWMALANETCFSLVSVQFGHFVSKLIPRKQGRLEPLGGPGTKIEDGLVMTVGTLVRSSKHQLGQGEVMDPLDDDDGADVEAQEAEEEGGLHGDAGDTAAVFKPISELSGGQKALLGLALTFSLAKFQRCPLYILDEVGARRLLTAHCPAPAFLTPLLCQS